MDKAAKIVSNTVYAVGAGIALILTGCLIFGGEYVYDPNAMIPWTLRESASIWLTLGTLPMVAACYAVIVRNGVKQKLKRAIIALPGFVCAACAVFWLVILARGYLYILFGRQ